MKPKLFPLTLFFLLALAPKASAITLRAYPQAAASLILKYQDETTTLNAAELASFKGRGKIYAASNIAWPKPSVEAALADFYQPKKNLSSSYIYYQYRPDLIYAYVKKLAANIDKAPQEPAITIADNRAAEFIPPENGVKVDLLQSTFNILEALKNATSTAPLAVKETSPASSLEDTNNLGISELVGRGESNFKGSPKNRIHNITAGVEKMKGIIVAPGGTFSFNKYLGPVDGEHGFLPELVIKKTGTVPEFGGGLCQVSSTAFRAAMNAGLPIKERKNHAYAVQYYSPQGTDATIYPGVVDLKFLNDTPGAILIWPYVKDKNKLIFDFYGTRDSRQTTLEKPVQWDRKPDGSMKASWTRVVTKDGETSTSTFKSIYLPPALFHKTEEFAKPTATITSLQAPAKTQ